MTVLLLFCSNALKSLKKHYDDLVVLLAMTGNCFDILGGSKTWLKEQMLDFFNIDGYSVYFKNRVGKIGGSVRLDVKSHLSVKECNDLTIDDGCSESLFIEIKTAKGPSVIIGVVYR